VGFGFRKAVRLGPLRLHRVQRGRDRLDGPRPAPGEQERPGAPYNDGGRTG